MADIYKSPAIPALPPKLDPQLRQFLSAIKETMEVRQTQRGNALDTGVNWRDLVDKGLINIKDGAQIGGKTFTRDQLLNVFDLSIPDWITSDTAPASPTGLTVSARQTVIELNWDACVSDNYGATQVWRASNNDLSEAVLVGSNAGTSYVDRLAEANAVYWYWIRHDSKAGDLFSAFNDVNGVPTVAGPAVPSAVSGTFSGPDYVLTWSAPTSNLVVQHYRLESLGALGWVDLTAVGATLYRAKAAWLGDRQFKVRAVDVQGNAGPTAATTLTIVAPTAPAPTVVFTGTNAVLMWAAPLGGTLPVASYKVYELLPTNVALVADQLSTTFAVVVTFSTRTYYVSAVDTAGNEGPKQRIEVVVTPPVAPTVSHTIDGPNLRLNWVSQGGSLPIASYSLRQGTSYEVGTPIISMQGNSYSLKVDWLGAKTFWIIAIDSAGVTSAASPVTVTITTPTAPVVAVSFVGSNAVLKWTVPTGGSLPVASYKVYDTLTTPGALVSDQLSTTFAVVVTFSSRTYYVSAVDTAGNEGPKRSVDVLITAPATPVLTAAFIGEFVRLTWSTTGGSLPVAYYNLRQGASYEVGTPILDIQGTTYSLRADWTGSRTFWLAAVDSSGTASVLAGTTVVNVSAPSVPVVANEFSGTQAVLSWPAVVGSLPVAGYEVRYGTDFVAGVFVERITGTSLAVPVSWTRQRMFWVAAYDALGNFGNAGSKLVDVTLPSAPTVTTAFAGPDLNLRWTAATASMPVAEYEILVGDLLASAQSLGRVKGTTLTRKVDWLGAKTFWLRGIDQLGNVGVAGSATVTISQAVAPAVTAQVIDNNVLIYWNAVQGTLPTATYLLKKGGTWAGAVSVGTKNGEFTTVFETIAGSYTYWIAALDSAGNVGLAASVTVTVTQPPDYVLGVKWVSSFSGTKSNAALDGTRLLIPVSTSETFEGHFTARSWTSPQNQIDEGYPYFAQPGALTGYYQEDRDYGLVLAAMKVTVDYLLETVAGSLTPVVTITTALDAAFTTGVQSFNGAQAFPSNFRYLRVRLTVTGADNKAVGAINGLSITLDAKLKTASGTINAVAGDVGGTLIYLTNDKTSTGTKVFLDVDSVDVTPLSTTPLTAVYDFVDAPNPLSLRALLFNSAGARVSGIVSYTVRGY